MTELTVASVMTHNPVAVRPYTCFKGILELLAERNINAVPVVSATGAVIGVVSEVDLLRNRRHPPRLGTTRLTAVELMTSPALTVPPDTALTVATRMLLDSPSRSLFVVADGRLVGVLSPRDVLSVFRRPDKEIHADIEREIFGEPSTEPTHTVRVSVEAGVVLLTGRLPLHCDIQSTVARVAEIPGVIDIQERTR